MEAEIGGMIAGIGAIATIVSAPAAMKTADPETKATAIGCAAVATVMAA